MGDTAINSMPTHTEVSWRLEKQLITSVKKFVKHWAWKEVTTEDAGVGSGGSRKALMEMSRTENNDY